MSGEDEQGGKEADCRLRSITVIAAVVDELNPEDE